jgi:hypothetical protein
MWAALPGGPILGSALWVGEPALTGDSPPGPATAWATGGAIAMSQVFFPEVVTGEIVDGVSGYLDRGQPDTSFESDNVLTSIDDIMPTGSTMSA